MKTDTSSTIWRFLFFVQHTKMRSPYRNILHSVFLINSSCTFPAEQTKRSFVMLCYMSVRRGLVVRISAFHAGGPGSIPGVGIPFFVQDKILHCIIIHIFHRKLPSEKTYLYLTDSIESTLSIRI